VNKEGRTFGIYDGETEFGVGREEIGVIERRNRGK